MKHTKRLARILVAGTAAATITAAPIDAAQAAPPGPDVPSAIAVPAGHKVFLVGRAVGVQIYACNTTPTGPSWVFVAPRANLYDDKGKLRTTHYAGPTWQAHGSTVVGSRVDGVTVDPTAIPWLLLQAASPTEGPSGGYLTKTTYIQRTATTGGLAPAAAECNAETAGTTVEVPYTANYHFWKATGRGSD